MGGAFGRKTGAKRLLNLGAPAPVSAVGFRRVRFERNVFAGAAIPDLRCFTGVPAGGVWQTFSRLVGERSCLGSERADFLEQTVPLVPNRTGIGAQFEYPRLALDSSRLELLGQLPALLVGLRLRGSGDVIRFLPRPGEQ